MFGDYSIGDLSSIFVMQGFAGLILFSVFVLMALGLAIIFGQMGVINMAHGEFMILGAYVTWLTSSFFQSHLPSLFSGYFFVAMILAFIILAYQAHVHAMLWGTITGASVLAVVALSLLELFVAFLQAYIFVFLTALFMGMAMHPQH